MGATASDEVYLDPLRATLSQVDARFLLPLRARSALVLGDFPAWGDERAVGDLEIIAARQAAEVPPDLVVSSGRNAREALRTGAGMTILQPPPLFRPARNGAIEWRRYLALPSAAAPELFIPVDDPAALRYAFRHIVPSRRLVAVSDAARARIARHASLA